MAWLAVDRNGSEYIYESKPTRNNKFNEWDFMTDDRFIELPKGSIEKLIGRELTWYDGPIELQ